MSEEEKKIKEETKDNNNDAKGMRVHRGLGSLLSTMGVNKSDKSKPLPKVVVPKPETSPDEKIGFDLSSMPELAGWGDIKSSKPKQIRDRPTAASKNRGNVGAEKSSGNTETDVSSNWNIYNRGGRGGGGRGGGRGDGSRGGGSRGGNGRGGGGRGGGSRGSGGRGGFGRGGGGRGDDGAKNWNNSHQSYFGSSAVGDCTGANSEPLNTTARRNKTSSGTSGGSGNTDYMTQGYQTDSYQWSSSSQNKQTGRSYGQGQSTTWGQGQDSYQGYGQGNQWQTMNQQNSQSGKQTGYGYDQNQGSQWKSGGQQSGQSGYGYDQGQSHQWQSSSNKRQLDSGENYGQSQPQQWLSGDNKRQKHNEEGYDGTNTGNDGAGTEFLDETDRIYYKDECRRVASEYGAFVKVKVLDAESGKLGYFCELCAAECNAKKSLEMHCGGMKHLKKKNMFEKHGGGGVGAGIAMPMSGSGQKVDATKPPPGCLLPVVAFRDNTGNTNDGQDNSGYSYNQGGYGGNEGYNNYSAGGNGQSQTSTATAKETLSDGPTGKLIKRLAACEVKSDTDEQLATNVVKVLLKSLKDYKHLKGAQSAAHLLGEAEIKFSIMMELEKNKYDCF